MRFPDRAFPPSRVPAVGVALCVLAALAACTGGDSSPRNGAAGRSPSSTATPGDWSAPGLVDRDGQPFDVVPPAPATGRELLVTDFGADPEPDSGDDAPALRAALDEAEAGDTVVLPEGTFDLRSGDPPRSPPT